jgi:hypothetical protein
MRVFDRLLMRLGVPWYALNDFPGDTVAEAYEGVCNAPELVCLLESLGLPTSEVTRAVAAPSPTLAYEVDCELAWNTSESPRNAACVLARNLPEELLCAAYRAAYPIECVAERLVCRLLTT